MYCGDSAAECILIKYTVCSDANMKSVSHAVFKAMYGYGWPCWTKWGKTWYIGNKTWWMTNSRVN